MTAHVDSEIRHLSLKSLQQFIIDFPDRREDIIAIYIKFILTKVSYIYNIQKVFTDFSKIYLEYI